MKLGLIVLFAAAASSPVPLSKPMRWFTPNDYPPEEAKDLTMGTTGYDLMIDAQGKPVRCAVIRTSGSAALDRRACLVVLARAKFKPATDESGTAIPSAWTRRISWRVGPDDPGTYTRSGPPHIVLEVNRLPDRKKEVRVSVRQLIRADSTIENCTVEEESGIAALDRMACSMLAKHVAVRPVTDGEGVAVRGIRSTEIAFVIPKKGKPVMSHTSPAESSAPGPGK